MSPTVLHFGPYRFYFYSRDLAEPIHIHIVRDDNEAKFWLDPVRLAANHGFSAKELRKIEKLIHQNDDTIRRKWNEHLKQR